MKALRFDDTLKLEKDVPVVKREGEALIEVLCAGICNTDLEIVKGYAGFRGILGHEFVGRVVEAPDDTWRGLRVVGEINVGCQLCSLCQAGDARHCLNRTVLGIKDRAGAFAEYLSLPLHNLLVLPDSIADDEAVFVEPLAAACRILEQLEINSTSKVAVIGDGKLAQLIIRVLANTKCSLTAIGKHKDKLDLVDGISRHSILIENTADILSEVSRQTNNEKFDVVVEASGSATGLPLALSIVKARGKIVLKTTINGNAQFDLSQAVVNEIQMIGSRCGRFEPAIKLLQDKSVDVRPLITEKLAFDEGLRAFEKAASANSMKIILQMSAGKT
jgi:threonine dehydrogenase-like Zn-dependent dehydrogenase